MYLRGNPIAFAFFVSGVLHGAFRYGLRVYLLRLVEGRIEPIRLVVGDLG